MGNLIDLTGKVFGRLTVLERSPSVLFGGRATWKCRCGCPTSPEVFVRGEHLRNGATRSCGCLALELHTKHGLSRTRSYQCLVSAIDRCDRQSHKYYKDYGGRGVTVCQGCRNPVHFVSVMGECPEGMELDRTENNGGYWCGVCEECLANGWPMNMRFSTRVDNCLNKRNNVYITVGGVEVLLVEVAAARGISVSCLRSRIRSGMTGDEAVSKKVQVRNRRHH